MPFKHRVKPGECFVKVALSHGFSDFTKLYEHPDNERLKESRPNPNVLYPGDVIEIPALELKHESVSTGQKYTYVLHQPKKLLRLTLLGDDGVALQDKDVELEIKGGPPPAEQKTDGDGRLEVEVPLRATRALLRFDGTQLALRMSHLTPVRETKDDGLSGCQARLQNLGYNAGRAGRGPTLATALALFQADHDLEVTAELDDDTRDKLLEKHGS